MDSVEVVLITWGLHGESPRLLGRSTEATVVAAVREHLQIECAERLRQLEARPEVTRGSTGSPHPKPLRLVRTGNMRKEQDE
jgi:hypothetical protein